MVSSIYLIYSSAKCVVVVLISYNTKQVAQRTGIYLHKVANAVDEDHLYETASKFFLMGLLIDGSLLSSIHFSKFIISIPLAPLFHT